MLVMQKEKKVVSNFLRAISLTVAVLMLPGCGDSDIDDLVAFVKQVKEQPKGRIEPLPEFRPYESFTYKAAGLRSPFSPEVEVKTVTEQLAAKSNVKPDLNRPKEFLEQFNIESISLVGSIARFDDKLFALLRDSDGGVHRLDKGNYLGRNHGRVVDVVADKIEIIEIVPNGQGGWIERPRVIQVASGDDSQ